MAEFLKPIIAAIKSLGDRVVGSTKYDIGVLLVQDSTGTQYIRREVIDSEGQITITYENFDGTPATPTAPITVTSLVLPSGASTSANQATLNNAFGVAADTAATTDTGSWNLVQLVKRLLSKTGSGAVAGSDGVMLPIDSLATTLGYTSGNLTTLTVVYGGNTYIQTLTYTSGQVTSISQWVKQ